MQYYKNTSKLKNHQLNKKVEELFAEVVYYVSSLILQ